MQRNFLTYVLLLLASTAFGQATLRIGDPLELRVGGVPAEEQAQVNNVYTVDATGAINLPYIGKVSAEGITPSQLARSIEETYRERKRWWFCSSADPGPVH